MQFYAMQNMDALCQFLMIYHEKRMHSGAVVVCALVDGGAMVVCALVDGRPVVVVNGGAVVVCALVDGRHN